MSGLSSPKIRRWRHSHQEFLHSSTSSTRRFPGPGQLSHPKTQIRKWRLHHPGSTRYITLQRKLAQPEERWFAGLTSR